MATDFDTHLEIEGGRIRCKSCGEDICSTDETYKEHLPRNVKPLTEANPLIIDPSHFVDDELEIREYYCPGCATLLEAQMMKAGSDILEDKEVVER